MSRIVFVAFLLLPLTAEAQGPEPVVEERNPREVEVVNFPETQEVEGTVNVGNLPLDDNGRVLVATEAQQAGPLVFELESGPITIPASVSGVPGPGLFTSEPFDVAGYDIVGVSLEYSGGAFPGTTCPGRLSAGVQWRWLEAQSFTPVLDEGPTSNTGCAHNMQLNIDPPATRWICRNRGTEAQIVLTNSCSSEDATIDSIVVFLN